MLRSGKEPDTQKLDRLNLQVQRMNENFEQVLRAIKQCPGLDFQTFPTPSQTPSEAGEYDCQPSRNGSNTQLNLLPGEDRRRMKSDETDYAKLMRSSIDLTDQANSFRGLKGTKELLRGNISEETTAKTAAPPTKDRTDQIANESVTTSKPRKKNHDKIGSVASLENALVNPTKRSTKGLALAVVGARRMKQSIADKNKS